MMKALTVWQPWATLLACGAKQYETRSWETKYRGPIAIHAAARPMDDYEVYGTAFETAATEALKAKGYDPYDLPRSCIIATAELVACHYMYFGNSRHEPPMLHFEDGFRSPSGNELLFGDWTPGRYAWEFANMRLLSEPIPCKGAQGLWSFDERLLEGK